MCAWSSDVSNEAVLFFRGGAEQVVKITEKSTGNPKSQ